jgi:hypothetical protein
MLLGDGTHLEGTTVIVTGNRRQTCGGGFS